MNIGSKIWLGIAGLAIITVAAGVIRGSIRGGRMYRELLSGTRTERVELYISPTGNSDTGDRNIAFNNDTVCNRLNSAFKYFAEITPDRPRLQDKFVKMAIYKNEKIDLFISRTKYSGRGDNLPPFTR